MASKDLLDLTLLEEDLISAIAQDKLYKVRNAAKLRAACDQKVGSYDEFREIVNAAHLKPLEKKDKFPGDKKTVWNPLSAKRRNHDQFKIGNSMELDLDYSGMNCPGGQSGPNCGGSDLVRSLRRLTNPQDRYLVLKSAGVAEIERAFRTEVPVGLFGEILEALATFPPTTRDVVAVARILEALASTKRFSLSLEFLSCSEKSKAVEVLDKLGSSLKDRQQDLAEQGVTEWTVSSLKDKYRLANLGPLPKKQQQQAQTVI